MTAQIFVYDPAQGKVVERKDKWVEYQPRIHVINDSMPTIKSPINGKLYFDSKREYRRHIKQHGFEEIGTDYENEEACEKRERDYQRERERPLDEKIKQNLIDRMIHGKR